jgi:hypothetical protein
VIVTSSLSVKSRDELLRWLMGQSGIAVDEAWGEFGNRVSYWKPLPEVFHEDIADRRCSAFCSEL